MPGLLTTTMEAAAVVAAAAPLMEVTETKSNTEHTPAKRAPSSGTLTTPLDTTKQWQKPQLISFLFCFTNKLLLVLFSLSNCVLIQTTKFTV